MRTLNAILLAAASFASIAPAVHAADFPERAVRIVVPFPAGAAADAAARVVAKKLGEYWHQPVIVDNRAGVPGIQSVAIGPADGYTLLLGAGSSFVTTPLMNPKLPYDVQRDFVPVGQVLTSTAILTAHPSLGVKSVKELIALARSKPGQLNFSSSGVGSPNHLAMELFESLTHTEMVHVPYKGAAPSVTELMAGHVQLGINALPSVIGHIKAGKLTPLGVASARRDRALPDVPTIAEAGVPGFDYTIWYGVFAPAKVPAAIVNRISDDLQRALHESDVAKLLIAQGNEPAPSSAGAFASFIRDDTARWAKIIKDRKLKLDE
jgi:tripartite-type tricarboxylate transporter receptor subunit TctC